MHFRELGPVQPTPRPTVVAIPLPAHWRTHLPPKAAVEAQSHATAFLLEDQLVLLGNGDGVRTAAENLRRRLTEVAGDAMSPAVPQLQRPEGRAHPQRQGRMDSAQAQRPPPRLEQVAAEPGAARCTGRNAEHHKLRLAAGMRCSVQWGDRTVYEGLLCEWRIEDTGWLVYCMAKDDEDIIAEEDILEAWFHEDVAPLSCCRRRDWGMSAGPALRPEGHIEEGGGAKGRPGAWSAGVTETEAGVTAAMGQGAEGLEPGNASAESDRRGPGMPNQGMTDARDPPLPPPGAPPAASSLEDRPRCRSPGNGARSPGPDAHSEPKGEAAKVDFSGYRFQTRDGSPKVLLPGSASLRNTGREPQAAALAVSSYGRVRLEVV